MKTRHEEMEEKALEFHQQNPKVWEYFVQFSMERIARGFAVYSVNGIFERIRWETDQADVDGKSSFKLSNNHRAFYARWFMKAYPEYNGFFRLRPQRSKALPAWDLPEFGPQDFPYEGDNNVL